jgi:hypothetical protein
MVMTLFIAMVIGVIGTIVIERQFHKSNRSEIRIPVRNEDQTYFRYGRNYRR